ncbi:MAG TPA: glutathione synthase [Casimicrobiaceae bacterium]|nr:glutathione synthase [Casimicrobiaceae bacterium]
MDFAFILDPLPTLKAYKDSSVAMMRALARRGHRIHALGPADLRWEKGNVRAPMRPLGVFDDDHDWYREGDASDLRLADVDAVLMRKDPPFDLEYLYATHLLELAEHEGARVFNKPRALRDYSEKLAIAKFASFTAPTLVARDVGALHAFVDAHGDAIVKPLDGMGGTSIFRVRSDDPNRNVIFETVAQFGARTVMIQRYIPEIADGDKRILIIGGAPVPFALARIPKPGETRGNLAAGGRGVARPLTDRDREIAESVAPTLVADGLLVVGLDVIGPYLTEVNVTSPTCFVEITAQTGFGVAELFADALLAAVSR